MGKELLRLERFLRSLRQDDLAAATGISQPRISRIERGTAKPRQEEKRALAAALGVNPVDLWPVEEAQAE